jgi:hypothetical protein
MDHNVHEAKRTALITGLRQLADFLADQPDLPAPWATTVNVPVDLAVVAAVADVLDEPVEEHMSPDMGRLHSVRVAREFGVVSINWYAMDPGAMAEYEAQRKLVKAAAWILVCDAGNLPTTTTYATEQAAREVLAEHTTGCAGGHTVHLVSPVPGRELVQA